MLRTLLSSKVSKDDASGLYVEVKALKVLIEDSGPMGAVKWIPRTVTETRQLLMCAGL